MQSGLNIMFSGLPSVGLAILHLFKNLSITLKVASSQLFPFLPSPNYSLLLASSAIYMLVVVVMNEIVRTIREMF